MILDKFHRRLLTLLLAQPRDTGSLATQVNQKAHAVAYSLCHLRAIDLVTSERLNGTRYCTWEITNKGRLLLEQKSRSYIIWSPEGKTNPKVVHGSKEEAALARHEMAHKHVGQTFYVCALGNGMKVVEKVVIEKQVEEVIYGE